MFYRPHVTRCLSNPLSYYSPPCFSRFFPPCMLPPFTCCSIWKALPQIMTWLTPSLSSGLYSNVTLGEPPWLSTLAMSTITQCIHHLPPFLHLAPITLPALPTLLPFFSLTCYIFYISILIIFCPSPPHMRMWHSQGKDFVCFVNDICNVYTSICVYSTCSINTGLVNGWI